MLGIDCHTMAAKGPPLSPDTGEERPYICLSNADHTCPDPWFELMARCFENSFGFSISVNYPFKGGYIIRSHKTELPWIQIEFSRADFMNTDEKRRRLLKALSEWCGYM